MMYYYFSEDASRSFDMNQRSAYNYVWSPDDRAFVRYTSVIYDPHDNNDAIFGRGVLVAALPLERLPIIKSLRKPMVFTSPAVTCVWLQLAAHGVPPMYDGSPLIQAGPQAHVQPNGLIINVSAKTFSWNSPEEYPFAAGVDGMILTVLDTDGSPIDVSHLLNVPAGDMTAHDPAQAQTIVSQILQISL